MNARHIVTILAVAAALGAGSAPAQRPATVAKLANVQGNVLVSQADAMVAGSEGQRLALGTRVVTTAGARVTISYDIGCNVPIKENERSTVRLGECAELLAEVVPLGPAAGAIGGGAGGVVISGAASDLTATGLVIGAIGIIGVGAYDAFKKQPVSPS